MQTQTEGAGPSRLRSTTSLQDQGVTKQSHRQPPRPSDKVLQWYTELVESQKRAIARHREGIDYKHGQELHDTSDWLDWTPREQSCFFAAVSRHSRLRADLVAHDCDKPESEVLLYLDSLDRGLVRVLTADQSDQARKRKGGLREGKAKSAREMTESWITEEELLAGHLFECERQTERMEEQLQTSKNRRIERAATKARVRRQTEEKAERHDLRGQGNIEQQSRWAREDWGRAVGWDKLERLDKLTRPNWSEWYADRIRRPTEKPIVIPHESIESPSTPPPPSHSDKHTKIAVDNATLKALLAIDKRARSSQQRADLTKLLNRKRNRENTRLQKLLQAGKTENEIKSEGGVDKAYLKSIGKNFDAETLTNTLIGSPVVPKIETPFTSMQKRLPSKSLQETLQDASTVSEDDPALQDLRNMGLDTYLAAEHLDIINFSALASQYAGPDISLPILETIVMFVTVHLRQLIQHAILVAEAEALQSGDDIKPAEIETAHVEYAIAATDDTQRNAIRVSLSPHDSENPKDDVEIADSGDESGLTEEEDNEIEQAATDLDEKMDSAAELLLWQAAEELSLPELEQDDIIASRKAYRGLLASVSHARRHRYSIKRRSGLFPSTGFRRPSRMKKRKVTKSAAYIETSDDEMTQGNDQIV